MRLQKESTVNAATEKHVPVVELSGVNVMVKVGEVENIRAYCNLHGLWSNK